MFQQGKRIQNLNEDHQGTRLLLDNHLLRSERRNLDVDGHLGIINSRIDRRRRDVASLEQRLDDLEAANVLLTAKVAAMEPRLCHCGREGQPIVVEDGEREESSPSVSARNFALLFFLHIPSCIAISRDPSRLSRNACPTLHPPLRFINHDLHDPNDSYDLHLKINQSPGVYRDV